MEAILEKLASSEDPEACQAILNELQRIFTSTVFNVESRRGELLNLARKLVAEESTQGNNTLSFSEKQTVPAQQQQAAQPKTGTRFIYGSSMVDMPIVDPRETVAKHLFGKEVSQAIFKFMFKSLIRATVLNVGFAISISLGCLGMCGLLQAEFSYAILGGLPLSTSLFLLENVHLLKRLMRTSEFAFMALMCAVVLTGFTIGFQDNARKVGAVFFSASFVTLFTCDARIFTKRGARINFYAYGYASLALVLWLWIFSYYAGAPYLQQVLPPYFVTYGDNHQVDLIAITFNGLTTFTVIASKNAIRLFKAKDGHHALTVLRPDSFYALEKPLPIVALPVVADDPEA